MRRKQLILAGAAGIGSAVILGAGCFFMTHVFIDGQFFPKNAARYDLTAHALTREEYSEICERFPESQILWTVPFQGKRFPMDTTSITVSALTKADAESLDLLPDLQLVDGTACDDVSALIFLQQRRPEIEVLYRVNVGDQKYDQNTQILTVRNADATELEQAIPALPLLHTVTLEGTLPEPEAIAHLMTAFPNVEFCFTLKKWGQQFSQDVQSLDLSSASVTKEELDRILPLLPRLKEINLKDTPLTDKELKSVATRFPDTFFLCNMEFAGQAFSTDAEEIDISGCPITVEDTESTLAFFPKLQKLVMSYCGIDDETMDALNKRHPEVSIVWTVQIGRDAVRTDAKYFFPAGVKETEMPWDEHLVNLRYCTEMVAVDIGHSHATNCEWAKYLPHLKYLILADTEISDLSPLSELKELIYLEIFRTGVTDYSPLLGCTALQDLNIGTTHGDPEPLSHMTWLHNLKWNRGADIPETRDRVLMLPEQLPDTNVWIINDGLNIGQAWRYIPNYYVFRDIIGGTFFNQLSTTLYWGNADTYRILSCEHNDRYFAGDILATIIRDRIDKGLPIPGIKNIGSEKAEILYQSLCDAQP